MSDTALKAAYDKVLTLPEEAQAVAADILEAFVEQQTSDLALSSEQIAEIERRLADPSPEYATDEEVEDFFRRALHED